MSEVRMFHHQLRNARKFWEMTQAELAEKAGLQTSAISHFESARRRPSLKNICRLATALNCSVDYLLGRKAQP